MLIKYAAELGLVRATTGRAKSIERDGLRMMNAATWILILTAQYASAAAQEPSGVPATAERGAGLTAGDVNEGWIALFDGESLFGWQAESDANWRVENGCIAADQGTSPGLLRTSAQFDRYELRLEFQADAQTNSGVFVRTSPRPTNPQADCFEVNIAPPENPFPTGSLVARIKATVPLDDAPWHRLAIDVLEDKIVVEVDDRETAVAEGKPPFGRGYIGLQYNSGPVRFRNIRLRPLGLEPLHNGRDLLGWKSCDEMPGKFAANDGVIVARGGPGQLESESRFADFVLQFQVRLNAGGLNSGLFFRSIPGERMNGYEVQIDNAVEDNDSNKPKNGGTGAIFRRNAARRVLTRDREWSAITLVATGNHMSVWVNGHQVSDWKDERPKHSNPRHGLRLEAGTIILQAHDETTDVSFAAIQAAELAARQKGERGDDPR
jgi:hypothetical protein